MRCDVNISLRRHASDLLGAKVELKNLNSTSAVRRAILFEIERQTEELNAGIPQVQSTRRWDDDRGETQMMRTKEDAHDYRYFPCPDLLPLDTMDIVDRMKKSCPSCRTTAPPATSRIFPHALRCERAVLRSASRTLLRGHLG